MIFIEATPQLTLIDEKVKVTVRGVEPGSNVTLRSELEERKIKFEAHAHYQADDKGEISLTEKSSLGGSYIGVEPMGMFWSMQLSPGQKPGFRYAKKDVTTTMDVTLSVYKGHLNTEVLDCNEPLATTLVQKTYIGPNVERLKVHHGRIRGMLYKPKGPGPFPAIIDMFGNTGGIIEFRSALFASRGLVSYCLPYFAYEDLPKTMDNLELEYFEVLYDLQRCFLTSLEAIDWLMSQTFVFPGGIGTVGNSTGGSLALLLASYFPEKVSAAVSINGSTAHMTPGLGYKGVEFHFQEFEMSKFKPAEDKSICGIDLFTDPKTWNEEVFVKVEKATCPILFVVGEDDLNWPTSGMVEQSIARLKVHGKNNYHVLSYHKTGHLIEPPYAPVCIKSYHNLWGAIMRYGGSLKEHADAQEDAWRKMLQFFYKHVGGVPYTHTGTPSKL
ncbi:acyl-coenzyme A thioesterase 1-like [Amphiura filiformis]|uniref:acyl-coenzyme A thioesterase 1-like n=1 Tax=Amphiura filiformis TaxID=82378 RepID=UPI003B2179CC